MERKTKTSVELTQALDRLGDALNAGAITTDEWRLQLKRLYVDEIMQLSGGQLDLLLADLARTRRRDEKRAGER